MAVDALRDHEAGGRRNVFEVRVGFARRLGLAGTPLAVVVVIMATLLVGSNALISAQRYDRLQAQAMTAIVFSTLAFASTASLWLGVLAWLDVRPLMRVCDPSRNQGESRQLPNGVTGVDVLNGSYAAGLVRHDHLCNSH